jgi:dihydrodipicolinate synthase/N-acetylneuraminate lyase
MSKSIDSRFRGVVVPMLTPVTADGDVDPAGVKNLVDLLNAAGVHGIFPLGTTGESSSVSQADKRKLIELVVQHNAGKATVYAGISGNCYRETIDLANDAKRIGAAAVVAHPPSYFPINDAEIEAFLQRLADDTPLPLVLYNIPQTTRLNIPIPTVVKLSTHANVVALKDSSPDAARIDELLKTLGGRGGFPVLLGNSSLFTHGLKRGGIGIIPSGAHLVGKDYVAMMAAADRGDFAEVERLQGVTDAACAAYLKGNSIGQGLAQLKAILSERGVCPPHMLPPLIDHARRMANSGNVVSYG